MLLAKQKRAREERYAPAARMALDLVDGPGKLLGDTIKTVKSTNNKIDTKVKEVPSAKRQPKPEKVDNNGQPAVKNEKPKRERRPDGMERPPEIPRRNDN